MTCSRSFHRSFQGLACQSWGHEWRAVSLAVQRRHVEDCWSMAKRIEVFTRLQAARAGSVSKRIQLLHRDFAIAQDSAVTGRGVVLFSYRSSVPNTSLLWCRLCMWYRSSLILQWKSRPAAKGSWNHMFFTARGVSYRMMTFCVTLYNT